MTKAANSTIFYHPKGKVDPRIVTCNSYEQLCVEALLLGRDAGHTHLPVSHFDNFLTIKSPYTIT